MGTNTLDNRKKHEGRNIKRLREIIGMKQETLAGEFGVNQQRMSAIEQKEEFEEEMMQRITEILKVPEEAIRNFDEEKIIYNISCSFTDNAVNNNALNIQHISPIDAIGALKKNEELYEKLLQAEREKNDLLQRMLNEK